MKADLKHIFRMSVVILLCFEGLWGCGLLSPVPIFPSRGEPGIGPCETEEDCVQGQECYSRYCRSRKSGNANKVSLLIIPPPHPKFKGDQALKVIRQQFIGVDIRQLQDGKIWPRKAFSLKGTLLQRTDPRQVDSSKPFSARMVFSDQNIIPGHPLRHEVFTNKGRFQVDLSYGNYRLEIYPTSDDLPPHVIPSFSLPLPESNSSDSLAQDEQFDVVYPSNEEFRVFLGRIITVSQERRPLSGLEVHLIDKDGWMMSNTVFTDKEGRFRLLTARKNTPTSFRIRMKTNAPMHPETIVPFKFISKRTIVSKNQWILGDIPIGYSYTPIRIQGNIGATIEGDQTEIGRQPLFFNGQIDLGQLGEHPIKGRFQLQTQSDKRGHYRIDLPPGQYQIGVVPSLTSSWARTILDTATYEKDENVRISLNRRYRLRGDICELGNSNTCKGVGASQIQAIWNGPVSSVMEQNWLDSSSLFSYRALQSTENGMYELQLDPGIYQLMVIPPLNSGFARKFELVQVNKGPCSLQTYLTKATYLVGQMIGPDHFPFAGVGIEMYKYTQNQEARLLGKTVTLSLGQFSLGYAFPQKTENMVKSCQSNLP